MALPLTLLAALMPSSSLASFTKGGHISIPFNNKTALNTETVTSWVSSADRRGTGDILYSCTITIILCIFTVLHLNVPAHGEKAWKQYSRKVQLMFTALLAPEIVLLFAFTQYSQARRLCRILNGPVSQQTRPNQLEEGPRASNDRPQVSLSYGFFAVMGGFVVDVSKFCDTADQITLNVDCITALASHGQYLPVRTAEIQDRSKANALGKGLVCLQIAWMLVQCSARKAAGYPLTLLELHTFVHVICAVALYALWFKKPLDVTEPSVVELQQEDYDTIALALVSSDRRAFVLAGRDNTAPGLLIMGWKRRTCDPHLDQIAPTDTEIILKEVPFRQACNGQYKFMEECDLGFFYARLSPKLAEHIGVSDVDEKAIYKARLDLTEKGGLRHRMAQRAATKAIECDPFREHNVLKDYVMQQTYSGKVHRIRSSNAPFALLDVADNLLDVHSYKSLWERSYWPLFLALVILTATNGSVHLGAWQFEFATITEKWLWRSSCIYIAVFALPVLALTFLFKLGVSVSESLKKSCHKRSPNRIYGEEAPACTCRTCKLKGYLSTVSSGLETMLAILYFILLAVGLPPYVFARFFLVIESFISLRHVPIGVYAAVPWSNYIPHL